MIVTFFQKAWIQFSHEGVFITVVHLWFQDDQEDITSFALSCDDEVKHLNCHGHFLYLPVKDFGVSVFHAVCLNPVAGDCEQSTAAEAVGLEASTVHTHLEGYSHCARGQYDLWLHLHPPGHRSTPSGFIVSVGFSLVCRVYLKFFFLCLLNCRWLWWNHKALGCGETVLHSQPQRVLGCSTVSSMFLKKYVILYTYHGSSMQ